MDQTTNYNLKKPGTNDNIDIGIINDNMDIIDDQLKTNADNISNLEEELNNINVPVKSVNEKIGDIVLKASDIKTDDGTTLEEVNSNFKSHFADYMYQIPNITGTQIRINRLSNTNRLFFKLGSDLSGGAITISTDGGTTEKPLQDVDGNSVTALEKGFVEVVADANFFTLRNRGISALQKQALVDIVNAAETNQSSIKTNIATGLNTGTGSSLTSASSWIDIQNIINNMSNTNKKYKIGVTNTDTNGVLTVSGLPFRPKSFILTTTKGTYRGKYSYTEDITMDSNLTLGGYLNSNGSNTAFVLSSVPTITSNSFIVNFGSAYFASNPVNWIACG